METYKSIQQAIFNNWFDGNCTTDIIHEWNVLFLPTIVNKLSFVVPNGEIKQNFETAVVLRKEYTTTGPSKCYILLCLFNKKFRHAAENLHILKMNFVFNFSDRNMLNTVLIRFIRAPKDSKLMYIRVKLISYITQLSKPEHKNNIRRALFITLYIS